MSPRRRHRLSAGQTPLDRFIGFFSPEAALRRFRARTMLNIAGSYVGASKSKRSLVQWVPNSLDADSDLLPDLATLRDRSRDLIRNNPLAAGAIATKINNVVGTGLRLQARIDRQALNLTDAQADAWEAQAEREWHLFWDSPNCDAARTLTGDFITRQVYRQAKENGEAFVVLPRRDQPPFPYELRLQIVEADRVCNENYCPDTETLAGGIEKDDFGAPVTYHILKQHPGAIRKAVNLEWQKIPAFGQALGLRNVIHFFDPGRPGQSRGVPDLAPVIDAFKQVGRYTESELMAAVVSGMFTVFIETESGDTPLDLPRVIDQAGTTSTTSTNSSGDDVKLSSGSIIALAKGEKVHDTNPGRPNAAFDPFVLAILRQIGVALQLPYEVLTKHFTSSYSAARAAILEAWKYFLTERKLIADCFLQIVYEIFMVEAVAKGRLAAPGFLTDYATRKAYLGAIWTGPARGQIDELREVSAAEKRVALGVSTLSEVTAEMTGGDWEKKHPQTVKEYTARKAAGLIKDPEAPQPLPPTAD